MPNRFAIDDQRTTGGDWFAQNHPDAVSRQPNSGTPYEQGGFSGQASPQMPTSGAQASGSSMPSAWTQPVAGTTPTTWQEPGGWTGQAAVGGPEQFGGNYEQWFRSIVGERPWNQQTLNALMPTLQHYGIKLTPPNANGDQTKIQLPTGEWVRVGFGEGKPVWIPQTNAQGQSLFSGSGAGERNPQGGVNSPWAIPAPFQSPSMQDLQNEPGYQARYQQGLQGLERGAAAQGSLLSGGTQKALARYGQDYASNEYGNAYNRAYQNYMGNFHVQSETPWNRYSQVLDRGLNAAQSTKTNTPLFGS